MAGAIVRGMIASGKLSPSDISCACGADDTGEKLSKETGISLLPSLEEIAASSDSIVLACKPQQLAEVASQMGGASPRILVSILAGTTISNLRKRFPRAKKIVRVMPNMPAQISMGISCYAPESELDPDERATVESVLSAIGEFMPVDENKLDAVTALSGSGPGYLFEFAAAMINAGEQLGFTREEAKKLTSATLLGSATLLDRSNLEADELCAAVSSPGGTTLAALEVFKKNNFRKTVSDALKAAAKRSRELSQL